MRDVFFSDCFFVYSVAVHGGLFTITVHSGLITIKLFGIGFGLDTTDNTLVDLSVLCLVPALEESPIRQPFVGG